MRIYYEHDVLSNSCKNRCPFAGAEFKGNKSLVTLCKWN